jgi:hypothetical protein
MAASENTVLSAAPQPGLTTNIPGDGGAFMYMDTDAVTLCNGEEDSERVKLTERRLL